MIIKKNLSEQIYDQLKMDILTQKIKFGEKLINKNLQERFNVSSTPIRDAVNRLYNDGLIASKNNSGAVVIEADYEYYCEINEILQFVQLTAVSLSFKKGNSKEVIKTAKKILKKQEEHIEDDLYFDCDYEFHKIFIDFSENNTLKKLFKNYNVLSEVLTRSYSFKIDDDNNRRKDAFLYHKRIVEEYEKGNIINASNLTIEHYEIAQNYFKEFNKKNL